MLAHQLREIANKISSENVKKQVDSAVEYLESLSLQHAKSGVFGLKKEISKLPFTRDILEKTFVTLGRKGYVCRIDSDITAWYSNTDYDSEDFLIMNW